MLNLSAKLGELLIKATQAPDIDIAFRKILSEYFDLKLKKLQCPVKEFEYKWKISFEEFKDQCQRKIIKKDIYSYEVEKDFCEWERIETLKKHYAELEAAYENR